MSENLDLIEYYNIILSDTFCPKRDLVLKLLDNQEKTGIRRKKESSNLARAWYPNSDYSVGRNKLYTASKIGTLVSDEGTVAERGL